MPGGWCDVHRYPGINARSANPVLSVRAIQPPSSPTWSFTVHKLEEAGRNLLMVGLHTSQMFQKGCVLKIFRLAPTVLDSNWHCQYWCTDDPIVILSQLMPLPSFPLDQGREGRIWSIRVRWGPWTDCKDWPDEPNGRPAPGSPGQPSGKYQPRVSATLALMSLLLLALWFGNHQGSWFKAT